MDQISMFDLMYPTFKTDNPVRLIELFAGVGSQAMALRNLGVPFEHYLMSEWEMHATASYKAIVVNVLVAILGQLFIGKEDVYRDCKVKK